MHIEITEISSVVKKFFFTISKETVNKYFKEAFNAINKQANIKGFRLGMAPREIVSHIYKNEINQKAVDKIISNALFKTLKDQKIKIATEPEVTINNPIVPDCDFLFTAHIEILPNIELKFWKGLEGRLPARSEITEELIDKELENLGIKLSTFEEINDRSEIRIGDFVNFSYIEEFDESKKTEAPESLTKYGFIEIGGNSFFPEKPDMEKIFINSKVGDTVTISDLVVTILSIKKRIKPKIDDEFAKNISPEFSNIAALRADIASKLQKARIIQIDDDKRQVVLDLLIEENPFDIPDSLVREQSKKIAYDVFAHFPEKCLNEEKMMNIFKPQAIKLIKSHLLLSTIAKEQNVEFDFEKILQLVLAHARLS